ncbi:Ribosomal protein L29 [Spironucleus salmonicida]|uniref:Ribosomal L29 protein n=1 Tax=Spironucleus salmonicida TaxID=348837 RepID=V6M2U6_9EUKA|nr:Ribosomal protein L29 [Spironucleus salmonicida]|eukprot:EST47589.1 Ribosomal L29 protein [Spironucleus salmonicida]
MAREDSKLVKLNKELKAMTKEELQTKLDEYRREHLNLRVSKVVSGRVANQLNRLSDVQKDIARVLTQIRTVQLKELAEKYESSKVKPKRFTKFTTKARRLALSTRQQQIKPNMVTKRHHACPKLNFALKH